MDGSTARGGSNRPRAIRASISETLEHRLVFGSSGRGHCFSLVGSQRFHDVGVEEVGANGIGLDAIVVNKSSNGGFESE